MHVSARLSDHLALFSVIMAFLGVGLALFSDQVLIGFHRYFIGLLSDFIAGLSEFIGIDSATI